MTIAATIEGHFFDKTNIDWKFGLITRTVYRAKEDLFYIEDTSGEWLTANATLNEMTELANGTMSLGELKWY